ncbi:MAG TPA: FAD/NAD(P)-binding protein [Coleofasciculaceae cyanobacterium]
MPLASDFPSRITIIGGGASGSLLAVQLLRQATRPLTIYLIDRSPQVGLGIAYSTQVPCHLLNVPAGYMSAFPDDPTHFLRWVNQQDLTRSLLPDGVQPETYVPRLLFGAYLQAVLNEAEAQAKFGVSLERVNDEAIAIQPHTTGATVHLHSGRSLNAQKVILALGTASPSHPSIQTPDFYNSDPYVASGWSTDALRGISPEQPILLVGAGLTMIDQALILREQGHHGKIHVISRHGLLPQASLPPAGTTLSQGDRFKFNPAAVQPKTTRKLLRFVREQIKAASAQTLAWQVVIDAMRPVTETLWQSLSVSEQQRFLRHVRPYWDIHRHRIAPEVAEAINELLQSGQMIVYAGRIQSYHEHDGRVEVVFRERHTAKNTVLQVSRVVNCTGPSTNYRILSHPLIMSLRSQGLLCPDPLALGIQTDTHAALLTHEGKPSDFLYALGPPLRGRLWETIAIPEIRIQAQKLAQELVPDSEAEAIQLRASGLHSVRVNTPTHSVITLGDSHG